MPGKTYITDSNPGDGSHERADPSSRPPRALAPDIARGLMLALIAIANVSWFLWGHEGSVGTSLHISPEGPIDSAVQFIMTVAVDQRAIPLFTFLFGYGMVQFYRSRIDRGMDAGTVRIMLRRRHWAMLLLGLLHAALLFYGDILGAYAIAGLLLVWIFFGRRDRTLWIWVWAICGLLTVYALFSIVAAVALTLFAPAELVASMAASGGFDMSSVRDLAYDQPYWISALFRIGFWLVAALPIALTATPLPILLGWIAARRRILDEPWNHIRLLRRVAVGGIAIGWLGGLPQALMHLGVVPISEAAPWAFTGLTSFTGVACGLGYAAAFGLLAVRRASRQIPASDPGPRADRETRRAAREEKAAAETALTPAELSYGVAASAEVPPVAASPGPLPRMLSAVGQRSLTFYLFQSLLHAPLMASWAFGLGEHLSTTQAVAIALGVWAISLPIAALMDSRGVRGPAEVLLRRMTYGKYAPSA